MEEIQIPKRPFFLTNERTENNGETYETVIPNLYSPRWVKEELAFLNKRLPSIDYKMWDRPVEAFDPEEDVIFGEQDFVELLERLDCYRTLFEAFYPKVEKVLKAKPELVAAILPEELKTDRARHYFGRAYDTFIYVEKRKVKWNYENIHEKCAMVYFLNIVYGDLVKKSDSTDDKERGKAFNLIHHLEEYFEIGKNKFKYYYNTAVDPKGNKKVNNKPVSPWMTKIDYFFKTH